MKPTTIEMNGLIEAATVEAASMVTITRGDGSTFQGRKNYGSADNGVVQVYVVPVTQRTRTMKDHYRVTYYTMVDGHWKRCAKVEALAALDATGAE